MDTEPLKAIVTTNQYNDFSVSELHYLRTNIENMTKINQLGILRILNDYIGSSLKEYESKYGVQVNLSCLEHSILEEMFKYVKYVNSQQNELDLVEQKKKDYKNTFFLNVNKESANVHPSLLNTA
jgi:hypothetical protein